MSVRNWWYKREQKDMMVWLQGCRRYYDIAEWLKNPEAKGIAHLTRAQVEELRDAVMAIGLPALHVVDVDGDETVGEAVLIRLESFRHRFRRQKTVDCLGQRGFEVAAGYNVVMSVPPKE